MKKLYDLISGLEILEFHNLFNHYIEGITYNSLMVKDNFVFFAIKGTAADGNEFIPQAISKGAKVIVTEYITNEIKDGVTYLIVSDARKFMALVARRFYNFNKGQTKIIGVTGTNGKTTITFLISGLLNELGKKTAIIGTTGIYIDGEKTPATHTTPESIHLYEILEKIFNQHIEYIIMEVSSHSLVQSRVYGIDFDYAIYTNLTPEHLDYHKTMQNYATAKKLLFDSLNEEAIAILNSDDDYVDFMIKDSKACEKIFVGTNPNSDFIIKLGCSNINEQKFVLQERITSREYCFKTNLIGEFNISNMALAVVTVSKIGFKIDELQKLTPIVKGARGRMEKVLLRNGAIGIVDYAHTPDALEKAIKTLLKIKNGKNIITVFGCGGDRDKFKRPAMGRIASLLSDVVIITNDNPRSEDPLQIINEIANGIDNHFEHKIKVIPDRAQAIKTAFELSKSGDIILVAGKGHENYQIIGKDKIHFDDLVELSKYA